MGKVPLSLCLVAGVAACGISAVGTMPSAEEQTLPDGGTIEAGAPDASGCRSITTNTPGSLVAPKVTAAPTVDGDLSDWQACFVPLDRNNAYFAREIAGTGYVSGEFSVVHDGTRIYVAARIIGLAPVGDHAGPDLYLNDSAEVYFDADGVTQQTYTADTLQIVVDHTGRHQGFRNDVKVEAPSARSAARIAADGVTFTLELVVAPETFGRTSFPGTVAFDIAFTNGSGTSQLTQIIWFQKCRQSSGCGCINGNDAPYCDARQFGSVMLEP